MRHSKHFAVPVPVMAKELRDGQGDGGCGDGRRMGKLVDHKGAQGCSTSFMYSMTPKRPLMEAGTGSPLIHLYNTSTKCQ